MRVLTPFTPLMKIGYYKFVVGGALLVGVLAILIVEIRVHNLRASQAAMSTDRDINAGSIVSAVRSMDIATKGGWSRDFNENEEYSLNELIRRYTKEFYRCRPENLWGEEFKFKLAGGEVIIFGGGLEEPIKLLLKFH